MKESHHYQSGDRYIYDFDKCSTAKGFAQVDTSQDASYFGTWANPFTLTVINYCEGDVYTCQCDTPEEFKQELQKIKKWNEENGHRFIGIDPGFNAELKARFIAIGLDEFLH